MARPTVFVIHDDGKALDVLARMFEASGQDSQILTAVLREIVDHMRPVRSGAAPF